MSDNILRSSSSSDTTGDVIKDDVNVKRLTNELDHLFSKTSYELAEILYHCFILNKYKSGKIVVKYMFDIYPKEYDSIVLTILLGLVERNPIIEVSENIRQSKFALIMINYYFYLLEDYLSDEGEQSL